MVIDVGEIVHVIDRRGFEADLRRHFVGVVEQVDKLAIRVVGYAFIYDTSDSTFIRRDEKRTRVIPLTSGLIINVAPPQTDLENVRYAADENGHAAVTDGGVFTLNITEFGPFR